MSGCFSHMYAQLTIACAGDHQHILRLECARDAVLDHMTYMRIITRTGCQFPMVAANDAR
jgi:hypothetical protein